MMGSVPSLHRKRGLVRTEGLTVTGKEVAPELDAQILTLGLKEESQCYGVAQRSYLILPCFVSVPFTSQRILPFLVLRASDFSFLIT